MKKKEKNLGKDKKKEKKQKEPKEYIPPELLPNLINYTLINNESDNNTEKEIEENKTKGNYFSNYKPDFIPCKIAEEWTYNSIKEINEEIFSENNGFFSMKENSLNQENIIENNKDNSNNTNNSNNDLNSEKNSNFIQKLNNIIKLDDDSDMFLDKDEQVIKDNLPLYLVDILSNEIKWKRPYQYIIQHYLWEKVKNIFPKKKQSVICNEIIETYKDYLRRVINGEISEDSEDEKNVNNYLSNEVDTIKNRIFKEFYPIIDKEYNIRVCDYISRLETEREYQDRKECEMKEKNKKTTKKN